MEKKNKVWLGFLLFSWFFLGLELGKLLFYIPEIMSFHLMFFQSLLYEKLPKQILIKVATKLFNVTIIYLNG
jgi:hypothetical protein